MKLLNTAERRRVVGERVQVPEFVMVSCPSIRISDLKVMRFNVIDRMKDAARRAIELAQDRAYMEYVMKSSTGPVEEIRRPPDAW